MQLSPQNGINKLYELNHTSYVYFTNDARSFVPESNGVVSTATKMLELPILLGLEMTDALNNPKQSDVIFLLHHYQTQDRASVANSSQPQHPHYTRWIYGHCFTYELAKVTRT
jgi:hypothetical protein